MALRREQGLVVRHGGIYASACATCTGSCCPHPGGWERACRSDARPAPVPAGSARTAWRFTWQSRAPDLPANGEAGCLPMLSCCGYLTACCLAARGAVGLASLKGAQQQQEQAGGGSVAAAKQVSMRSVDVSRVTAELVETGGCKAGGQGSGQARGHQPRPPAGQRSAAAGAPSQLHLPQLPPGWPRRQAHAQRQPQTRRRRQPLHAAAHQPCRRLQQRRCVCVEGARRGGEEDPTTIAFLGMDCQGPDVAIFSGCSGAPPLVGARARGGAHAPGMQRHAGTAPHGLKHILSHAAWAGSQVKTCAGCKPTWNLQQELVVDLKHEAGGRAAAAAAARGQPRRQLRVDGDHRRLGQIGGRALWGGRCVCVCVCVFMRRAS
jgi:hypothetical protein